MAVWIYAYGRNEISTNNPDDRNIDVLNLLNAIEIDELKILEMIRPSHFIREYYTENRSEMELRFKQMDTNDYNAYLSSIKLPKIDPDKLIDRFIADGEKREFELISRYESTCSKFKAGEIKSQWEINGENSFINRICYFDDFYDGITVNLINDLVRVSGPSSIFSHYFYFLRELPPEHRQYYHTYFIDILKAFKSDFILYTHEWSGLDDEDNPDFDFRALKESSNWEATTSTTLETMDKFYFEPIS